MAIARFAVSLLLAVAAVAVALVSAAAITRHPGAITAIDVASGERVTSFIVVFQRFGTYGPAAVPLTRLTLDEFLVARLPSFSAFNARQGDDQYIYSSRGFVGFSAMLSESEVSVLASDPDVAYIEEDMVIELDRIERAEVSSLNINNDVDIESTFPTWGTDRSDQRALPLNNIYKLPITKEEIVAVPNVYMLDTGVNTKHVEFQGRAVLAKDFLNDGEEDCNGQGTHAAGTVGGVNTGIAPFVNIFGVRVMDCNGRSPLARILAGIDWVVQNHVKPAILVMGIGGTFSQPGNDATAAAINAGIVTTIASGNQAGDACRYSPGSTPGAINVNSMNRWDEHSSSSNYGNCTVVYAPGERVLSAWHKTRTDYESRSGTGTAVAHVGGAAALFLARKPNATPAQVLTAIICSASNGTITGVPTRDTPNRLLYLEAATMKACLP